MPITFDKVKLERMFRNGVTIMLIPLDNRPVNSFVPQHIAASGGINLLLPPSWMLGNHRTKGMATQITNWMFEYADQADIYIVSADMLAYGGLLYSRSTSSNNEKEALQNLKSLEQLKKQYPQKPIYVFDTIQRLTTTVGSNDDLELYHHLREWSKLKGIEQRHLTKDLKHQLKEIEQKIPHHFLTNYTKNRERNHKVNLYLIEMVSKGVVDYLLFGQDDAGKSGIHTIEQTILQSKIKEEMVEAKVEIIPGADQLDVLLISRYYNLLNGVKPSFHLTYSTLNGNEWIPDYEDIPLAENIKMHINVINGTITLDEQKADFHLIVNTNRLVEPQPDFNHKKAVALIERKVNLHYPIILADVANYKADSELFRLLVKDQLVPVLFSYAAWNTPGNTLGLALSHASIHNVFLQNSYHRLTKSEQQLVYKYHLEYLFHRFLKDYYYKREIVEGIRNSFIGKQFDEWNLATKEEELLRLVQRQLQNDVKELFCSFNRKSWPLPGDNEYSISISNISMLDTSFPWNRLFELDIQPTLELKLNSTNIMH